jgi:hypothetical protein
VITLLLAALGLLFAFLVYLGVLSGRHTADPGQFVDGGMVLAPWVFIFGATGVVVSTVGLHDHFLLTAV